MASGSAVRGGDPANALAERANAPDKPMRTDQIGQIDRNAGMIDSVPSLAMRLDDQPATSGATTRPASSVERAIDSKAGSAKSEAAMPKPVRARARPKGRRRRKWRTANANRVAIGPPLRANRAQPRCRPGPARRRQVRRQRRLSLRNGRRAKLRQPRHQPAAPPMIPGRAPGGALVRTRPLTRACPKPCRPANRRPNPRRARASLPALRRRRRLRPRPAPSPTARHGRTPCHRLRTPVRTARRSTPRRKPAQATIRDGCARRLLDDLTATQWHEWVARGQ